MKFTAAILSLASFVGLVVADGKMFVALDQSCDGNGFEWDVPNNGGQCIQLEAGVHSVRVQSVDPGCSFTIYADNFCSDNAIGAGPGQCIGSGSTIPSFSYDC
ncbi:hypothetical protein GQ53DRAFT_757597 [Thozetella sp. PMI_491]|nr:hypothetical protein GQ53DRAFT_757597 [Thozetella sp. PMI_491]